MPHIDELLVHAIALAAAVLLVWPLVSRRRSRSTACGGCGKCAPPPSQTQTLVQITLPNRTR